MIGPPTSGSWAARSVRLTLTPAACRMRLTVAVAITAAFRSWSRRVTRTLAISAPMPKKPALPLLSTSTSASSRSTSSSFSASSIASSTVLAVITRGPVIVNLLGFGSNSG